jgi:hypothetical protein
MRALRSVLAVALALAACRGGDAPPGRGRAPAGRDAGVVPRAAAHIPVAVPAAPDPAAARALVDAWLVAQNAGHLADYEALYAARFAGIKRAGVRTTSFDRAGWMRDRGRMFRKPMTVVADEIEVELRPGMVVVTFTQTFLQGNFRDRGPKELVLVPEAGTLRIAREEMKASSVADAPGRLVVQAGGVPYAILEPDTARIGDDAAFVGLGAGDGWGHAGTRPLSAEVAGPLAVLAGSPQIGYPGGTPCSLGPPLVLHLGTPHFMTEMAFDGDADGDGVREEPPLEPIERDRAGVAVGHAAARLEGCPPTTRYALDSPGVEWRTVDDAALAARAVAAFMASSAYRAVQADFAGYEGATGRWIDRVPEGAPPLEGDAAVLVRILAAGPRRLVVVGAEVVAGCGDFNGAAWLAYEVVGDRLVARGEVPARPDVAVAVDAASLPVLISGVDVTAPGAGGYRPGLALDLGYRDCGC